MAWFLPKDYVGVNVRVDQAHEKHKEKLSIVTTFDIKDQTVIFNAKVTFGDQVFTGHSFGQVWKEKAFEKLETVAVWRALAFAGFETREWIASREEMEVWESKEDEKPWFNDFEKMKEEMRQKIISGERTPAEIIENLEKKYRVSKTTKELINNLF